MVPVTGLNQDSSYQSAVASLMREDALGACLRLFRSDLSAPGLAARLDSLLVQLGLHPEDVDLVIDYQITDDAGPTLADLCTIIPLLRSWRTFTVASGSFPLNLADLEKNRQHELPRLDWLWWRRQVSPEPALLRAPSYSDYAIQHPTYRELEVFPNFSASI